jgi:ligand-binding sensor domain-containing protein
MVVMIRSSGIPFKVHQICLLMIVLLSSTQAHVSELDSDYIKSLPIEQFGIGEEFDSAQILCLEQDDLGFIWIGTDRGLFRFDGHRFIHYAHQSDDDLSLHDDFVHTIFLDSKNRLWVGTNKGLHAYRSESDDFWRVPMLESESRKPRFISIRRVDETENGQLYVATFGAGVWVLDKSLFANSLSEIIRNPVEGMDDWRVLRVVRDQEGRVWISTVSEGLFRFDPRSGILESDDAFEHLKRVLAGYEVRAIKQTHDGCIWFGTHGNGIIKWNESTGEILHYYSGELADRFLISESIRHIHEDSKGLLWVSSQDKGVLVYDYENDSFEPISHYGPEIPLLGEDTVSALMEDERGDIWFSAFYGDAFHLFYVNQNPRGFRHAVVEDSRGFNLARYPVLAALEDSRGDFWIGTDGEGLIRWSAEGAHRFTHDRDDSGSIPSNKVSAVMEDNQGHIWIGTLGEGLSLLDVESGRFTPIPIGEDADSLRGKMIWSLFLDGDYLWVGTEKGLNVIETISRGSLDPSQLVGQRLEIPKRGIWSFVKDRKNRILMASISGLYALENKYSNVGEEDEQLFRRISASRAQFVHVAKDGRIWVALLDNGLFLLNENDELVRPFAEGMNLEDVVIHAISDDEEELLWMTTSQGFIRFNGNTRAASVFDSRWGFEAQYFWVHNSLIRKDGRIYFPSRSGLLFYDPSTEDKYQKPLETRVTGLEYFNRIENAYFGGVSGFLCKLFSDVNHCLGILSANSMVNRFSACAQF